MDGCLLLKLGLFVCICRLFELQSKWRLRLWHVWHFPPVVLTHFLGYSCHHSTHFQFTDTYKKWINIGLKWEQEVLIFGIFPMVPVFSSWNNVEILDSNFVLLVQKKGVGMGCNVAMNRCDLYFNFSYSWLWTKNFKCLLQILDVAFRAMHC